MQLSGVVEDKDPPLALITPPATVFDIVMTNKVSMYVVVVLVLFPNTASPVAEK